MAKRHKIPADQIVKVPVYLTPMPPKRGEFTRYTTRAPLDLWNNPTLQAVARHSFCAADQATATAELHRRRIQLES